jgi:hypothetical protein
VVPVPILCSVTFGKPMQVLRHSAEQGEIETDGEHYRAGATGGEIVEGHNEFAERARNAVIALRDV